MAVSLHPTCSSSSLHSPSMAARSSLSHASAGSRLRSPFSLKIGKPSPNIEFLTKTSKSSARLDKPTRSTITMAVGERNVFYRNRDGTVEQLDVFDALYRERIVFIAKRIDDQYGNQLLTTLLYLDTIDDFRKIFVYINGDGGDITPTMSVYDTMMSLQSPIATVCLGYTSSLATFLLAAGEKGQRLSMPRARIRLDSPVGSAYGQADEVKSEAIELGRIKNYLLRELSENTGQPLDKITEDMQFGMGFSPEEAVEYGLIDRVIRPAKEKRDAITP